MIDSIVNFYDRLSGWRKLFKILFSSLIDIITNPSFVMFSAIAICLSTLGIWITFIDSLITQSDVKVGVSLSAINIAIFTFCIATLGNMATEYVFEENVLSDEQGSSSLENMQYEQLLSKHAAFFLWTFSIILSFLALMFNFLTWYSLVMTLLLWLLVNINRPKFRNTNPSAVNNLLFNYPKENDDESEELEGEGLQ